MACVQPDLSDGVDWPEVTRTWWDALPSTPGADRWTASDWQYLLTTAVVHASAWSGDMSAMGELRTREEKYGITPAARRQMVGQQQAEPTVKHETTLDMIAERRLKLVQGGKK